MGVLAISLPVSSQPGVMWELPRGSEPAPVRVAREMYPGAAKPKPTPLAAQHGTLPAPPPLRSSAEDRLERTPEQVAEQEALTRLVRLCLAGDAAAWQQLVTGQHRRVYALCYRFTGSSTDAEDLTQDVFLKVYRNLATFDGQKGSFQTWITTLTRNLLVDHFRRTRMDRVTHSMDSTPEGAEDAPTPAEQLADTRPSQHQHVAGIELRSKIQTALKQVSPELREAVILRDLHDMDYREIAQVLRIPEGTVKSRISRGRGELARLLQRIEGQVV